MAVKSTSKQTCETASGQDGQPTTKLLHTQGKGDRINKEWRDAGQQLVRIQTINRRQHEVGVSRCWIRLLPRNGILTLVLRTGGCSGSIYIYIYIYAKPPARMFFPQQLKALGSQPTRVPRGFHQGSTRVPRGFHEVLRGLRSGASTEKSTACCWGYHLNLFFMLMAAGYCGSTQFHDGRQ